MIKTFRTTTFESIQVRIGLCSGPVTAGIIGEDNPHWALVGDTVNTASRMESTSKPMQIHISESTYILLRGHPFSLSDTEEMDIKGKGRMRTYWIYGR
jgi:class 3 adenylate cyclase